MIKSFLYGTTALIVALGISLIDTLAINNYVGLSFKDKELPEVPLAAAYLPMRRQKASTSFFIPMW